MKNKLLIGVLAFALMACGGSKEQETTKEVPPAVPATPGTGSTAEAEPAVVPGKGVYITYCQVCHMADGAGVAGQYPPIANSDWVQGDAERLIDLMLNGLEGEIVVNGQTYNGVMAAHNFLSDKQIAEVLTYIRSNFGNDASAVTPEEVAAKR